METTSNRLHYSIIIESKNTRPRKHNDIIKNWIINPNDKVQ